MDDDEVRQPTKTESQGQYRRREDQYLCIEIQPYIPTVSSLRVECIRALAYVNRPRMLFATADS